MRTAWSHFGTPLMDFWSRDLINVIFGKTAITPSFFKVKASNQNLNYPGRCIGSAQYENQRISVQKMAKMSLNTVTMVVAKILTCYISVTVPDRPMVTIIYR